MSKTFGTNKPIKSEGEYIKKICKKMCTQKEYNTSNLNSNLFTTLDLTNVSVILPTPLNNNVILFPPYLNYTIDPSGQLFGTCDSTYYNYLVPNQIKS